jgi:hypothetical protein
LEVARQLRLGHLSRSEKNENTEGPIGIYRTALISPGVNWGYGYLRSPWDHAVRATNRRPRTNCLRHSTSKFVFAPPDGNVVAVKS